jgi:hypothetical protein
MAKKRKPRVVHVVCKDAAGYRWLRQHSPEATGATVTAEGFAVVDEGKWAQALRAAGGQEL